MNFQKLDADKLDELLSCEDTWDEDDASDCFECFTLITPGLLDLLAPFKKLRICRQECPWIFNASLSAAHHLCDVVRHRALKFGYTFDWASYRVLHKKLCCDQLMHAANP